MGSKTKLLSSVLAVLVGKRHRPGQTLLCAALACVGAPVYAQADPACYVVNQVLLWLKPQFPVVECARKRAAPTPTPTAPQQAQATTRRQP